MKHGSKSNPKQGGTQNSVLGKRDVPDSKTTSKGSSDASQSTQKDMEAELLRLMRENDKLKNQLSDSQGEVKLRSTLRMTKKVFCLNSHATGQAP